VRVCQPPHRGSGGYLWGEGTNHFHSLGRAIEAPQIRRLFSCSPRDPRYHMLEHLSPKFKMAPVEREPRAALILNRFTRTLTVMFATNAVSTILGVRPDQIKDKSFYECIQENCLPEAIRCLESAKANDSIAYLRFWYRDPRREEDFEDDEAAGDDEEEEESPFSSDSEGGGAVLGTPMEVEANNEEQPAIKVEAEDGPWNSASTQPYSGRSSSNTNSNGAFGSNSGNQQYSTSAMHQSPLTDSPAMSNSDQLVNRSTRPRRRGPIPSFELEAVVSCTSDGLVVVLRKARPPIPTPHPPLLPFDFENGLFAAPWGQQPIRPQYSPDLLYTFRPPLLPHHMPLRENVKAAGGPPLDQLMRSIRDVAVFAWALVGINGNLAAYSHGLPRDESQPPEGLPIWDPRAANLSYLGPENQAVRHWASMEYRKSQPNSQSEYPWTFQSEHSSSQRHLSQTSQGNYTYASHPPMWLSNSYSLLFDERGHGQRHNDQHMRGRQEENQEYHSGYNYPGADQWHTAASPVTNQGGPQVPTTQSGANSPKGNFPYTWQ
jgi:hypothetical protein